MMTDFDQKREKLKEGIIDATKVFLRAKAAEDKAKQELSRAHELVEIEKSILVEKKQRAELIRKSAEKLRNKAIEIEKNLIGQEKEIIQEEDKIFKLTDAEKVRQAQREKYAVILQETEEKLRNLMGTDNPEITEFPIAKPTLPTQIKPVLPQNNPKSPKTSNYLDFNVEGNRESPDHKRQHNSNDLNEMRKRLEMMQ